MESILRERGIPLCSLESFLPLREFDIIGFSLQYELGYSNILKMLELAGIPSLAEQRDERYPLLIAGGPCTYNPEPIAPFFDAIVIGEGEEVLIELCDTCVRWKKAKKTKAHLLEDLSRIEGVYIPSYFQVEYFQDGTIKNLHSTKSGYGRITKRLLANLDTAPYCTASLVPFMQIIHDRINLEIARGCSRGCRFCMAGMIYRPVREKSLQKIVELAEKSLASTGYEELSLVSLSTGDFSHLTTLLKILMVQYKKDCIAVSLPSVRVETLSRAIMDEIKQVRKTGFTIAPEAGTQRLRNVINKGITEEEILETAHQVFSAGWNLIKLYFMIGLPTETPDDIDGIVDLAKKISSISKKVRFGNQINVSISTFVPKPHTPFQWIAQTNPEVIYQKQAFLKNSLRGKGIRLKWHNPSMSLLEGVFARGDRRLGQVLMKAHQMGAGFDGWSEHFKPDLWEKAFQECGIDNYFYLRERAMSEHLPWQHISCGVSTAFLVQEYHKALNGELTFDCRRAGCQGCGLCAEHQIKSDSISGHQNQHSTPFPPAPPAPPVSGPMFRYRFTFSKSGPARYLSHLELSRCIARTLRRARLPLAYSQGFHPLPRITFHDALPVGMASLCEVFEVLLTRRIPCDKSVLLINQHLPSGLKFLTGEEITLKKNLLPDTIEIKHYTIVFPVSQNLQIPGTDCIRGLIDGFYSRKEFLVTTCKSGECFKIDVRQMIQHLAVRENGTIEIAVKMTGSRIPKVADIIGDILSLGEKERKALTITKLPTQKTTEV